MESGLEMPTSSHYTSKLSSFKARSKTIGFGSAVQSGQDEDNPYGEERKTLLANSGP